MSETLQFKFVLATFWGHFSCLLAIWLCFHDFLGTVLVRSGVLSPVEFAAWDRLFLAVRPYVVAAFCVSLVSWGILLCNCS